VSVTTFDPVLPESAGAAVAGALDKTLADLLDLRLQAKQAHWNVVGPLFRSVHLELDEVVADLDVWIDDVAERLVAVGAAARGQAADVAEASALEPLPQGVLQDRQAVSLVAKQVATAAAGVRERLEPLAELDLVSQDLLIEVAAGLEKRLWMLRSQLS
jgi:starvation-inducible DNA-binding protein